MKLPRTYFTLWILFGCLACSFLSLAQTNADVWHKRVIREIDVLNPGAAMPAGQKNSPIDSNLMQLLVPPIKSGQLATYKTFDCNFAQKLTLFEINDSGVVCHGEDSVEVVDPVTNIEKRTYVDRSPHLERIHLYRVLEEWVFNPHTGKSELQIIGIAPARDLYSDDGIYRGTLSMFWVKYNDVIEILARYDRLHPTKTFANLIWDDYFYKDEKSAESK